MQGIADTGFLVAFVNRRDFHHRWALRLAQQISAPLLTCEAVLAESAFHLRSVSATLALLREGMIKLSFDANEHLSQLALLAERFADRRPDFADLCLIRMSELYPNLPVITVDERDFRVYRRNTRDPIPLVCPMFN
jgi:predicted nucleic acid-binding protein